MIRLLKLKRGLRVTEGEEDSFSITLTLVTKTAITMEDGVTTTIITMVGEITMTMDGATTITTTIMDGEMITVGATTIIMDGEIKAATKVEASGATLSTGCSGLMNSKNTKATSSLSKSTILES